MNRNCFISHSPDEKCKARSGAVAHTGSGEWPVALWWPGGHSSFCPLLWRGREAGQAGLAIRKLWGVCVWGVLFRMPGGLLRKLVERPWLGKSLLHH